MYGTTMKSYNINKSSKVKGEALPKKIVTRTSKEKKVRDTRYLKIENNAMPKFEATVETAIAQDNSFSKKEFPIPSVIITILLTMVMLVVVSGLMIM